MLNVICNVNVKEEEETEVPFIDPTNVEQVFPVPTRVI